MFGHKVRELLGIFCVCVVSLALGNHQVWGGEVIDLHTEKTTYVANEPIYLSLSLRGLEPGYPVNISVSLEFPDGTMGFLGQDAMFSTSHPLFILESWPFEPIQIGAGTWSLMLLQDLTFLPGTYKLRTSVYDAATEVLLDRSESTFTLVSLPFIDHVDPARGITGTVVNIFGQGFGQDKDILKVFIGGREATIMEVDDTVIKTWVPYGATTGIVQVAVDGASSNEVPFQVGPYIETLSAQVLSPGSTLTIKGFNFDTDKNRNIVEFNGVRGTVTSASTTQLSVIVPDGNTGPLTVTANDMTSSPVDVTISPVVESIDPPRGSAGDIVTISGRNFSPVPTNNYVVFNAGTTDEFAATVIDASTSQLVVKVPDAETGAVEVYTDGEKAVGNISFTYPPEIDSIEPSQVVAGDEITVSGRNFEDVEEKNAVTIGGTVLTIQSALPHSITARVPLGVTSGDLLVVVNAMESADSPFVTVVQNPILDSVSPTDINSTDTRTAITVTGVGFKTGTTLVLSSSQNTYSISPTLKSYTELTFTLPRGIVPGDYALKVQRTVAGRSKTSNTLLLSVQ